jgi:lipid-binding SYLF domain-containing protein
MKQYLLSYIKQTWRLSGMPFKRFLKIIPLAVLLLFSCLSTDLAIGSPGLTDAQKIDREVNYSLTKLYEGNPSAQLLARNAKAILVFPSIVKAGFMVGAQYGSGALRKGKKTIGYYNSVAASYGFQAGVQTFGYALFLMSDSAVKYLDRSGGWELGMGPSIVIVDSGIAKSLTTTTAKADVYGFIFDQKGLMAGVGLQGSKITRTSP